MQVTSIDPEIRLLNSANVWATNEEQLRALCRCPSTSAVTIRTSLLNGFAHNDAVHKYRFLDTETMRPMNGDEMEKTPKHNVRNLSSINTLGYSPISLPEYISTIKSMEDDRLDNERRELKRIVFSVTGSVQEIGESYVALEESDLSNIAMEVNLSCPNIPGKPPPAYSGLELTRYLEELKRRRSEGSRGDISIGVKVPPYTYQDQFDSLVSGLLALHTPNSRHPVDFITAINTLGSCLSLPSELPSENESLGPGGLGGPAIHSLALGNVFKLRKLLDQHHSLSHIQIIGVGGVSSGAGYRRMRLAGAHSVAIGTALGAYGVGIFEKVLHEAKVLQESK